MVCYGEELNYFYLNVKIDFFEVLMNVYIYKVGKCIFSYFVIVIILDF